MDSMTVTSRVSRPRPDVTEMPQINEQTLSNFYSSVSVHLRLLLWVLGLANTHRAMSDCDLLGTRSL